MLRALHAITSPQILLLGGNSEPHRVDTYDVICNRWTELAQTEIGREVFFEVLWYENDKVTILTLNHPNLIITLPFFSLSPSKGWKVLSMSFVEFIMPLMVW